MRRFSSKRFPRKRASASRSGLAKTPSTARRVRRYLSRRRTGRPRRGWPAPAALRRLPNMAAAQTLAELLTFVVSKKASDLHLGDGMAPVMRVDGELVAISETPFSHDQMMRMIREHLSEERFKIFERERELDYSFGLGSLGRFRVNLFYQRSSIGSARMAQPMLD